MGAELANDLDQWYRRIDSRFDRLFFFCVFRAEKLSRKARQKARNQLARRHSPAHGSHAQSSVTPRIHPRSPVVHFDPYNVLRCCCSGQDDPHEVVLRPLNQARSPFPQRHQGSRAPYSLRRRREGGGRFRTSQRRHRRCRVRPLLEDRRPRRRRSVAPEGARANPSCRYTYSPSRNRGPFLFDSPPPPLKPRADLHPGPNRIHRRLCVVATASCPSSPCTTTTTSATPLAPARSST